MKSWFGYVSIALSVLLPPVGAILGGILLKNDYNDTKALISVIIGTVLTLAIIITSFLNII